MMYSIALLCLLIVVAKAGVTVETITPGDGKSFPKKGDSVQVHYVGTLKNGGKKFDSSRDRNKPFETEIGVGQVIKCWDEGLMQMSLGENAILHCSSDYVVGSIGGTVLPRNENVDFEVELISIKKKPKTLAPRTARTELTPAEAADRLALRELFDAYAHCADRRDADGQKALFTDDTVFAVYMQGEGSEPTYVLHGREALTPVFADLNRYEATTHFNGQSTVNVARTGDRATGESYTIAHHVYTEAGVRKIMVASLRYLDVFSKIHGFWYFAERKLILDWSEVRTMTGML